MNFSDKTILFRGAGELASGAIRRLALAGFPVIALEESVPLCVRRTVCFASVVFMGRIYVEEVEARQFKDVQGALNFARSGGVAVIVDPDGDLVGEINPSALVDARMMKRNPSTSSSDAPLVIALGPGYTAPHDAHYVIETARGHDLGRVINKGSALPNTGIPGEIAGETNSRVLRAPIDGVFRPALSLGDEVQPGDIAGTVAGTPVMVEISGILRGLIHGGARIKEGTKVGDVDPRGDTSYLYTVSDKANAIAGGVLEAVLRGV